MIVGVIGLLSTTVGVSFKRQIDGLLDWDIPVPLSVWTSYVLMIVMAVSVCVIPTWLLSDAMYGNMRGMRRAPHDAVQTAMETNLFLRSSNAGPTWFSYGVAVVGTLGIAITDFGLIYGLVIRRLWQILIGSVQSPGEHVLSNAVTLGVLTFACILVFWLNNPFRLMRVAKRFRRGDYEFPDESVKRA